jgi:hypothetical protein
MKPSGRRDEAAIHEPGDLPSGGVDAINTGRGVLVDDPEDRKVFWSSLAPAADGCKLQATRGPIVSIPLKTAIDGALLAIATGLVRAGA